MPSKKPARRKAKKKNPWVSNVGRIIHYKLSVNDAKSLREHKVGQLRPMRIMEAHSLHRVDGRVFVDAEEKKYFSVSGVVEGRQQGDWRWPAGVEDAPGDDQNDSPIQEKADG